jgi:hypothetical protein
LESIGHYSLKVVMLTGISLENWVIIFLHL